MRLTKHDWAQTQVAWPMREAQPRRQNRDTSKSTRGLMANPKYVADLKSSMMQREIAEKWSVSQPMVSKHRMVLREVEHG
ncbi:hypothetical protein J4377_13590 [Halomonas sp. XH26]|uniref:hypothetical protein n=1 Tax=Halomonas sp. XH26 TaxID=2557993 RepID=UPI00209C8779|nr:hypothetical protein [Halomonas sp. XH26]UTA78985.1 hypothetical protein J4377_13590 [Halomonas sp. XH26]